VKVSVKFLVAALGLRRAKMKNKGKERKENEGTENNAGGARLPNGHAKKAAEALCITRLCL